MTFLVLRGISEEQSITMSRVRTSHYTPLSFHGVRIISLLFNVIIGGLLAYFLVHLRSDGFKLPWTLLVVRQSLCLMGA